jgi:hypothetical protein
MKKLLAAAAVLLAAVAVPALSVSASTIPATALSGMWYHVGWIADGQEVDVARLDLLDFPAGHLSGSWTEGVLCPPPNSENENSDDCYSDLGMNGTEDVIDGKSWTSFSVTGVVKPTSFIIQIGNNSNEQLVGGVGQKPAGAAEWYGCRPFYGASDLFIVSGSSVYVFYRASAYAEAKDTVGVGARIQCQ